MCRLLYWAVSEEDAVAVNRGLRRPAHAAIRWRLPLLRHRMGRGERMRLLQDGLVAMLAAIGLATLLWLIVSIFIRMKKETLHHVLAVIPARGGANGLEHAVHVLEQLRYDHGGFGTILIVDCGLNEVGRQVAALLSKEDRDVALCLREELPSFLQ